MAEHISPSVVIDGHSVQPEGWMFILAFALAGCQWAIDAATDPDFDLRGKMKDYNRRRSLYFTEQSIKYYEKELQRLKLKRDELATPAKPKTPA